MEVRQTNPFFSFNSQISNFEVFPWDAVLNQRHAK